MRAKHLVRLVLAAALAASLGGCSSSQTTGDTGATDDSATPTAEQIGDVVNELESADQLQDVDADTRVVALSQEAANMWLLAGGQVVGVVDEAANLEALAEDAELIGPSTDVNPETVTALKPELVIASSYDQISPQLLQTIEREGTPALTVTVDSFESYAETMKLFTEATGRDDLYERNVTAIGERVDDVIEHVQAKDDDTYVALRIEGESVQAATEGDWLISTLDDLGLQSLSVPAGELSADDLTGANPKWIFVIYGGDGTKSHETFAALKEQEAWSELAAENEGRVVMLPQSLFEYMPAARWAEAYGYFSQILHGSWA